MKRYIKIYIVICGLIVWTIAFPAYGEYLFSTGVRVEIHATIIENIIRGDFLIKPEWTTLIEAALILVLGLR